MLDPVPQETDPDVAAALHGPTPLSDLTNRFPSRGDMMRFYAMALANRHAAAASRPCAFCSDDGQAAGFYVLHWVGTVRTYWVRIALFSTVFLPLVIVALLLPVAIISVPNLAFGEQVDFTTNHPLCRSCWRRCRVRQGLAITSMVLAGLVLAVGFLIAAITGAMTASSLFGWWGFKPREATDFGLAFAGSVAACAGAKLILGQIPKRVLAPPALRHLAKRPFHMSGAKLITLANASLAG